MFCALFLAFLLSSHLCLSTSEEDSWIEPNAWGRHSSTAGNLIETDSCPVCYKSDTDRDLIVSQIYYKKLVANLIHRTKLEFNKNTKEYYRSISISLTMEQLDKLDNSNDPREMDAILSKVLENSRAHCSYSNNNEEPSKFSAHLNSLFNDNWWLITTTEVRFTVVAAIAALLIWFLHRRFNKSILAVIITSLFMIGYMATYYECNRKLETEEYIKFLKSEPDIERESWLNSFPFNYFRQTKKEKIIQDVRDSRKIKLPFCRPDKVFFMYLNEIFVHQFELFMGQCFQTLTKLKSELPFPFNYLSLLIFPFLAAFIIKLFFKHILSPKAWAELFHSRQHAAGSIPFIASSIVEDRLSGDNLKILLKALPLNPTTNSENFEASSGVEVIGKEADEINSNQLQPVPDNLNGKLRNNCPSAVEDITEAIGLSLEKPSPNKSSPSSRSASTDRIYNTRSIDAID